LQGDQNVTFAPATGFFTEIDDVIADQTGSGGTGTNAGAGSLTLDGLGTLALDAANTFTGDVTIDSGTLYLGNSAGAGSGAITFAPGADATVAMPDGVDPANTIEGFARGDLILFEALGYRSYYEAVWNATTNGGTLQIINTAEANAILATFDFLGSYSGEAFELGSTGGGAETDIALASVQYPTPRAGDVLVTGVSGQSYSAYEQLYNNGTYEGVELFYTNVTNQPYSTYAYDYSAGADFIGSEFFYTTVPTGANYTGYEYDYDGGRNVTRVAFTGVTGVGYSSYEYDFVGGVFAGMKFEVTAVPNGATYSSYELDYNSANVFTGDKFFFTNISGQSYTGVEEDFDASGKLARVLWTGVTGQSYSSLEEDFSAGTYTGYKAYYTGITNQTFTGEEVDVSATNQLEKVVYTGMSSTPYSSVEQDYSAGALTDLIYDFTNVSGASAYAYQVEDNSSGVALQEIYDNNDGSHTIIGLGAANQTFTSIADDTFTGGGASETFVFQPIYGSDTITDFYQYASGATHDTISLSTSEFANFAAVTAAATNVGSNVVINAADGDTLTLAGLNTTTLAALSADFTFHT
jgi:autotransporter-associated beta strand protein